MRALLVPVGERPKVIDVEKRSGYLLDHLQELVGGYIEAVYPMLKGTSGYINEEGKMQGLDPNPLASALVGTNLFAGDFIAGPMVVLGDIDPDGYDTPIAEAHLNAFAQVIPGGIEGWPS